MSRRAFQFLLSAVLLLLILVSLLGWGLVRRQSLDETSSQIALSSTEAALGHVQATGIVERAHPALLAVMDRSRLREYLESIPARLGDLQAITEIRGGSDSALLPLSDRAVSATYEIDLRFSNGDATAVIGLIRDSDQWLITDYTVDSPLLYD